MQLQMSAQDLWQTTLGELRMQMARQTYDTWLKPTQGLSLDDGNLVVAVPTKYAKEWLEQRLEGEVNDTVRKLTGTPVHCSFVVQSDSPPSGKAATEPVYSQPPLTVATQESRGTAIRATGRLNPRYVFDRFVVGAGNRLAHAAAQAVSEHDAAHNGYNPLFIYGGVGLGKTHLLHAVGHAAQSHGARVLLVTSEQFTNDLINAIGANAMEEFRNTYRAADLLLVDDIQFIAGKERTQEEFFHTFNAVHGAEGRIVMTSDRPPQAIATLEGRLSSRFQWGLLVDIEPPDLETRIAILRAKLDRGGPDVPGPVLELIAQAVQHNIRELEGALNRVVLYAQCNQVPLNVETARKALADLMIRRDPPTLPKVLSTVADYYRLEEDDLLGRSRASRISEPRQVSMYLMREEADASYPAIGAFLGGRDHTTVLHGCDKIGLLIERDAKLRRDVMQIRERLYA